MNSQPRQTLKRLFQQYGRGLVDDPRRTEALLRDYCGQHRREIFVLINAQKQQVPADLLAPPRWIPESVLHERLSRRLQEKLALTPEAADWAVDSWANVVGAPTPSKEKTRPTGNRVSPRASVKAQKSTPTRSPNKRQVAARHFTLSDVQLAYHALLYRVDGIASRFKITSESTGGHFARSLLRNTQDRVPRSVPWILVVLLTSILWWTLWFRGGTATQFPVVSQSLALPTIDTVTDIPSGSGRSAVDDLLRDLYSLPRSAWVEADYLYVRSDPSTDGPLVSGLASGERITVEEFAANASWARISEPETGWVSVAYLYFQVETDPEVFARVNVGRRTVGDSRIQVYASPTQSALSRDRVAAASQVLVVSTSLDSQWSQIIEPFVGWVYTSDLQ